MLLCHLSLSAQYAKFEYSTEFCDCKAQFDSTKYSRQQLQNTIEYLYSMTPTLINIHPFDFDEDIEVLLDSLESGRRQKLELLEHLDIVDDDFWQGERKRMIEYISGMSELIRVTFLAHQNPRELLSYKPADSTCIYFRDALIAGGDQLLKAWTVLNEMQKKKNASPEEVQRNFERAYNSPDRLQYARKEVLKYGWWNCANHLLPEFRGDGYEENFERLLKDVQCECEEGW